MIRRPFDDLDTCGKCHGKIAATCGKSLHYISRGQRQGVIRRCSREETALFDRKAFGQSGRSCHASYGNCHKKSELHGEGRISTSKQEAKQRPRQRRQKG